MKPDLPPHIIEGSDQVDPSFTRDGSETAAYGPAATEGTDLERAVMDPSLSESRYWSLVRATADLVWVVGPDGMPTNEIEDRDLFTGQRTVGGDWLNVIHPDDREETMARWNEAMANGTMFRVVNRVRRRDGEYRHMLSRAVPVRDVSGKIREWVGTSSDITERKAAEEALREQAALLDLVHETIMACDLDGTIRFWNRGAERMYGYTRDQAAGRVSQEMLKTEFPCTQEAIHATLLRDDCWEGEVTHTDLNGNKVTVAARWVLQRDRAGQPCGILKTGTDITARKKAESVLRASESRFRKLFESGLMGIGIPDRHGAFIEGNDELLRMVGYTREDMDAGRVRWDVMTPPEYAELDAAHIAEAAERGSCTPYEKEYIRKDGTRVPIMCGYALLEGSKDQYIGFILDLSPQKEAEAALRKREQQFRVLAESLPQLVWIRGADGKYVYCNQRLLDYVGLPQEWLQDQAWEAVHPDDVETTVARWKHSLETGEPYENEYRLRRHDGVYRCFLARAVAVRNEAGEIERWLGSSTDIHEQKLAEDALRRSEKLATAGRLAASMAHEINNPLASVMNSVYLALQDVTLSTQTRRVLTEADQELVRAAQFTAQTLRFHKQSAAPQPADLGEIMDSVLTMYSSRIKSSRTQVEREYGTEERLHCYNSELRQVFANLIGNALDAMKEAGRLRIRIRAGTAWNGTGGDGIRVTVADTGVGIPADQHGRLFEPFVSTKEETGVGLGLWVSQGIVQKHQGSILIRGCTHPARHGTVVLLFFPFGAGE
jgi:hypothetical protein